MMHRLMIGMLVLATRLHAQVREDELATRVPMTVDVAGVATAHGERAAGILRGVLDGAMGKAGAVAVDGNALFLVEPTVTIAQSSTVRTGVVPVSVVRATVSIRLRQANRVATLGAETRTVTGSGTTQEEALVNAMESLTSDNDAMARFFGSLQERVVAVYERDCSAVLSQARQAAEQGAGARAISILTGVPVAAARCHAQTAATSDSVVASIQRIRCEESMSFSRRAVQAGRFTAAATTLTGVPASAPCAAAASALAGDIERDLPRRAAAGASQVVDDSVSTVATRLGTFKEKVRPFIGAGKEVRERVSRERQRMARAVTAQVRGGASPETAISPLWTTDDP